MICVPIWVLVVILGSACVVTGCVWGRLRDDQGGCLWAVLGVLLIAAAIAFRVGVAVGSPA